MHPNSIRAYLAPVLLFALALMLAGCRAESPGKPDTATPGASEPPNIVFILTDDMTVRDLRYQIQFVRPRSGSQNRDRRLEPGPGVSRDTELLRHASLLEAVEGREESPVHPHVDSTGGFFGFGVDGPAGYIDHDLARRNGHGFIRAFYPDALYPIHVSQCRRVYRGEFVERRQFGPLLSPPENRRRRGTPFRA